MKRPRLLLADDEPAFLQLLTGFLSEEYDVVGTASDGHTLITAALRHRPDIIITDIEMPIMNGLAAARELKRLVPDAKVMVLSSHDEPQHVAAAFDAGAMAYLVKGGTPNLLFHLTHALESLRDHAQAGGTLHETHCA